MEILSPVPFSVSVEFLLALLWGFWGLVAVLWRSFRACTEVFGDGGWKVTAIQELEGGLLAWGLVASCAGALIRSGMSLARVAG